MAFELPGPGDNPIHLIVAILCLATGALTLRSGLRSARRFGLFTASFWRTFAAFARYRSRRLLGLLVSAAGAALLIAGAAGLYRYVRAYYAARLGHPGP